MPLFSLTFLALVAFAANSLLCRLALAGDAIDPVPFTVLRLASGALFLAFLIPPARSELSGWRHSLGAATGLFIYAFFFSLAYVSMDTGAGALVLFATIQIAMNTIALRGRSEYELYDSGRYPDRLCRARMAVITRTECPGSSLCRHDDAGGSGLDRVCVLRSQ